ncbi:hypothetical protein JXA88_14025 [Candidatus Fermentibacteria bacterium]|nr:hypothetical protein [Candidatus Fermentibacteria bacterium]
MLAMCSCLGDAPRDNPLDPQSGRFAPVYGHVMSLFPPHRPLEGVQVAAPCFGILDSTDSSGAFSLLYLPPESVVVVTAGTAFAPCTLVVPPSGPSRNTAEFYLNALPVIFQASVTSAHEETWPSGSYEEWISLTARVDDPDGMGDLDSVWCTVGSDVVVLDQGSVPGNFSAILNETTRFPFNAEDFVGKEFLFQAMDGQGATSTPKTQLLVRVVWEVATLLSPTGLEEVGRTPLLQWVPPVPAYPSALRVIVVRIDSGVQTTAWESPLYPALTDSARVGTSLSVGTYYWALYTIDSFGNSGRSREAAFKVVP